MLSSLPLKAFMPEVMGISADGTAIACVIIVSIRDLDLQRLPP